MNVLLKTLSGYQRRYLRQDLLSGLVIAAVSIPISMGYAQIAGLPAAYGLYGSVLPVLFFALFSTSPQFIFGVDAAPAAMVGSMVAGLGIPLGSEDAIAMVPLLAFYTGVWLLLFALLKAGKVLNFISAPVMGGFISGICCTIILMQVPKLMGHAAGTGELLELLEHIHTASQSIHWLSLELGAAALTILLLSKRFLPKFPMAILIMAAGAAGSARFDLAGRGVPCLSPVVSGLPGLHLPDFTLLTPVKGLGMSLSVAIVIMAETLLAENSFALRNDYQLNDNREILSFSLANFAACLVGCCPVNGSVSRSSMNEQFGGHTQLVSLVAAVLMGALLLFCTGFIQYLPVPILTAIVISALLGAVEFDLAHRLFQANRKEFYIFMSAFAGVLVLGTIYGVVIGVLLSFADVILRSSQPRRDFLGVIPDHPGFYPLDQMGDAQPLPHVVLYRFSGSLFFANVALFQQDLEGAITSDTKAVIVDASGIVSVDISAADRLVMLYRRLKARGIRFYLTEHISQVNDELRRFGAGELVAEGAVHRTMYAALLDTGIAQEQLLRFLPTGLRRTAPELLRYSQEIQWAYGKDAEEQMEQLTGQLIDTLAHTNKEERAYALVRLLHSGRWQGVMDRDDVLAHLEEHLAELAKLLERPEGEVLSTLEQERAEIAAKLRQEYPEVSQQLAEHRQALAHYLRLRYPETSRHLDEVRERFRREQHT